MQQLSHERTVDIGRLKVFALERLSKDHLLRDLLLAEPNLLDVNGFVAKIKIWLELLRRTYS